MARGRKPIRDAKRAHIVVRFQEIELNAIRHYANQQDKPLSSLIREMTLSYMEAQNVPTSMIDNDPNQLRIDTD